MNGMPVLLILFAAVLFCLFLIAPGKRCRKAAPALTACRFFAHRGLHGEGVPENSPEAFRLAAEAGSADYGAISASLALRCRAEKLFDVPPDCFMPRPKVTSTVIRLCRRVSPPVRVRDEEFFFAVVRAAFNQRRKTLVNAVSAGMREVARADVEKALAEMGLSPTVRGEALSAEQFAALSDILYTPNAG